MTARRVFAANDAEVWLAELGGHPAPEDVELLGVEELQRMDRYSNPADAAHFAGSRAIARRVIASCLSVRPEEVVIGRATCPACGSMDHGPPRIIAPSTGTTFSLSRSGLYALVAVAGGGPVGADIEVGAGNFAYQDVVGRFLTAHEQAYLATLPEVGRRQAFFRCWVRKEAVVKAAGVGIVADLASFDVMPEKLGPVAVGAPAGTTPERPPGAARESGHKTRWLVHDIALPPGVTGALALPAGPQG